MGAVIAALILCRLNMNLIFEFLILLNLDKGIDLKKVYTLEKK